MNTIQFINQFLELEEKITCITDLSRGNVDLLVDRLLIMGDDFEKKACFEALKDNYPEFAFLLGCDLDECISDCKNILLANPSFFNQYGSKTRKAMLKKRWILEFIVNNIGLFKELRNKFISEIVEMVLKSKNEELFYKIIYNDDLDIRGQIMNCLICHYSSLFLYYYKEDLENYLCIKDENGNVIKTMDVKIASNLAFNILDNHLSVTLYEEVKNFILKNYKKNDLALLLDNYGIASEEHVFSNMLIKDINELFNTSRNYKFSIYFYYGRHLNVELYERFSGLIKDFEKVDANLIDHLFNVGIGDELLEIIQKYMAIATGAKCVENKGRGSLAIMFKIGNYGIKLSERKWIKTRCPDSFLVAKNYEEVFARSASGDIIGAIEVQKIFTRRYTIKDAQSDLIKEYKKHFYAEFAKEGYCVGDDPFAHIKEPNLFYLDSYKDADCADPEQLPDWFKETPLVLVDRDYVYKKI